MAAIEDRGASYMGAMKLSSVEPVQRPVVLGWGIPASPIISISPRQGVVERSAVHDHTVETADARSPEEPLSSMVGERAYFLGG